MCHEARIKDKERLENLTIPEFFRDFRSDEEVIKDMLLEQGQLA